MTCVLLFVSFSLLQSVFFVNFSVVFLCKCGKMILYSVNSPLYCSAVVLNLKSDVKIQLQGSFNEDTTPEDFFPEFADLTGMCV